MPARVSWCDGDANGAGTANGTKIVRPLVLQGVGEAAVAVADQVAGPRPGVLESGCHLAQLQAAHPGFSLEDIYLRLTGDREEEIA